jgi:hypothetical protein
MSSIKGNKILFLAIISDKYSDADIDRLRQQLGIRFPTMLATGLLSHTWNKLIKDYCDNKLTDILLLINREGSIIRIADRECDCYQYFFDYLNRIN